MSPLLSAVNGRRKTRALLAGIVWAMILGVVLLVLFGASPAVGQNVQNTQSTTPGLTAEYFTLELTRKEGLARADEAIKAARLDVLPPTEISRGGTSPRVNAIIVCLDPPRGGGIMVGVSVANVASLGYAGEALRSFLSAYMKTGKTPSGGPAQGTSFAGEWDTRAGVSYRIKFTQSGNHVTGTYEGGEIDGTVTGDVLRFRWKQTNGNKGTGKFTLSADRKSFTGSWTYGDNPDSADHPWNGTRVGPPPGDAPAGGKPGGNNPGSTGADASGANGGENGGRKPTAPPPDPTKAAQLAGVVKNGPPVSSNAIKLLPPRLPEAGADHLGKGTHGSTRPSDRNRAVHILKVKASPEFADSDRKDSPHYLKVEIDLSEPLDADGMVEVYVGGYLTLVGDHGLGDAYNVKRAFPVGADEAAGTHYTVIFDMPDALPCPIRAEITASNSDTVVGSSQTRFTFPFPDIGVSKAPIWCELGDNFLRAVYLGISHGDLPEGATVHASVTMFFKKGSSQEFKGYAYQGSDSMQGYAAAGEISGDGVFLYVNRKLSGDADWDSMKPEAYCLRADGSVLRPLDRRKCMGFCMIPNGGYDSSKLRRLGASR